MTVIFRKCNRIVAEHSVFLKKGIDKNKILTYIETRLTIQKELHTRDLRGGLTFMKKSKLTTKQVVLTGMMTAVLAVLSIVTIPLPTGVPVTLQTFAMAFCGYVLGWKLGGASAALYVVLGAIGVPVYAGMSGGFGSLLGAAGGFIFGFIPMAMLCGAGIKKGFPGKPFVLGIAGLAVCHAFGVVQFAVVTGNTIPASFVLVSVPYIVKDVISVVAAEILGVAVRKALSAAHVMNYGTAA